MLAGFSGTCRPSEGASDLSRRAAGTVTKEYDAAAPAPKTADEK